MTTTMRTNLRDIHDGWPGEAPDTLIELYEADYGELSEQLTEPARSAVLALRRQVIDAVRSQTAPVSPSGADRRTLPEIFGGWPAAAPATLSELYAADVAAIRADVDPVFAEAVLAVRQMTVEAVHAYGGAPSPLTGPAAVDALIDQGRIRPRARRWMVWALDENRNRVLVPHPERGQVYLRADFRWLPAAEKLSEQICLAEGDGYLVIYGGSPDILVEHKVRDRLTELAELGVVDVLFNEIDDAGVRTLYSVKAGVGCRDGIDVPFQAQLTATVAELREVFA